MYRRRLRNSCRRRCLSCRCHHRWESACIHRQPSATPFVLTRVFTGAAFERHALRPAPKSAPERDHTKKTHVEVLFKVETYITNLHVLIILDPVGTASFPAAPARATLLTCAAHSFGQFGPMLLPSTCDRPLLWPLRRLSRTKVLLRAGGTAERCVPFSSHSFIFSHRSNQFSYNVDSSRTRLLRSLPLMLSVGVFPAAAVAPSERLLSRFRSA